MKPETDTSVYVSVLKRQIPIGLRHFRRFQPDEDAPEGSSLLKSIRAALQGAGSEPNPAIRTTALPVVNSRTVNDCPFSGEEELTWSSDTVVWSMGGVIKQKWCFKEEGQRVQYACFGWMMQPGMVHSSHLSSPAHYTSSEESDAKRTSKGGVDSGNDRDPFSPFFHAQKAQQKVVEPTSFCRGLYVFLRSIGKIFLSNGLEYTFSLPFVVRKAWMIYPHGVLIQRVLDPSELEGDDSDDFVLPTLFTLTSPFSEPQAVGLTEGIKYGLGYGASEVPDADRTGERPLRYVPADEQVIFVSTRYTHTNYDIIATIDSSKRKVSVWHYVHVAPSEIPSTVSKPKTRRLSRRGTSLGPGKGMRQSSHTQELAARNDRIREPSPDEFEPTQPAEFAEMPPLSSLPGMPPTLDSKATLASLAGDSSSWPASALPRGRQNSLNRNDLTSTMDRMVLGRRNDSLAEPEIVIQERVQPSYWAEKLYTHELTEEECASHKSISVSIYDQRFDGRDMRCRIAICIPASQSLVILTMALQEDKTMKVTPHSRRQALAAVSIRSTREHVWDLLLLKPDSELCLLCFDRSELPIALKFEPPDEDVSLVVADADLSMDSDRSYSSVVDRFKIVDIKTAIHCCAMIQFEDGSKAKASFRLFPSDHLTSDIFVALSLYVGEEIFYSLQKRFLELWSSNHRAVSPEVQFDCLSQAILEQFGWTSQNEDPAPQDPWTTLLNSSSNEKLRDDVALSNLRIPRGKAVDRLVRRRPPTLQERSLIRGLLAFLHVRAEELRLQVHRHEDLCRLVKLITKCATAVRPSWADYWKRLLPDTVLGWPPPFIDAEADEVVWPPDVWPPDASSTLYGRIGSVEPSTTLLETVMNRRSTHACYAYGQLEHLSLLRELLALYAALGDSKQKESRKRAENAVLLMAQRSFSQDFLSLLPLAIAMPLREAARTCQLGPPADWPVSAYEFVGRNDLTEGASITGDLIFNDGYRSVRDHLNSATPRKTFRTLFEEAHRAVHHGQENATGVELDLADFTDIRFGQDRRLQEVARMLRSSTIPSVKMVERPELSEHDLAKEQQAQVLRTAERTLALPLGRAMFTYGSLPTVTKEVYTIPKIELSVRLVPQNAVISPEPGKLPVESLQWAEFHNGVAAALRISPSSSSIDSSWITFNRPNELTASHAGFLYGLGLTGHLKEMLTWHTFGYLTPKHDLTSIGVLLGLSAANVGSSNKHVTKLLAVHTPALLPTQGVDLNVPLLTQAAGLVGIGLLYLGTKNRRMAEVALHQISRPDLLQPDLSNEHREAYTLAAALSFGMIMLGRGTITSSPADVALLSRLRVLIHGEAPSVIESKQRKPSFDVILTSPAASLALGLMYLKTERQDVADVLSIPDTVVAFDHLQPSFLLIRTIARSLIMWEGISPSKEWIRSQVPQSILDAMDSRSKGNNVDEAFELAYYNIIPGCCFAIGLKFAGTAREEAYMCIIEAYDLFSRSAHSPNLMGTAFNNKIRRAALRDGLNLLSLSLNMVMAGTGEINCLRRLRYAHGMHNSPIRYGAHMATHMSLGLLFLGAGRFTLGNSDAAIACMIAAFYPRFPSVSSDNKCYLQALRHLWVLAVEPRCLIARDVDTKEVVYLPMKIRVREGNETAGAQLISPTLIPSLDRLLSIKVDTPRYWPFLLDIANNPKHREGLLRSQTLFVKRRTMFLSYLEDPKGSRSLFVRSGMSTGDAATLDFPQLSDTTLHPASDLHHFITSFSNDISFIAFADRFCRGDGQKEEEKVLNAFCHAALLDCIIQDKPQILLSYVLLYRARTMNHHSHLFNLTQQDLMRTAEFYQKIFERRFSGRDQGVLRPALLRENSVVSALHVVDNRLRERVRSEKFQRALVAYVLDRAGADDNARSDEGMPDLEHDLAWYLQRHSVPYSSYLPALQELAQEALVENLSVAAEESQNREHGKLLEEAIKLVVHTSVGGLTRQHSSWSMESFDDVLQIWRSN